MDVEIYHFDAQLLHVRHHIFGNLFGNALPVLHHFFESDRTDDFTHITFQYLGDQADHFLLTHAKQRLCGALEKFRVRRNFDVCHTVYRDVDKFIGGYGLSGFHVYLHDPQRKLIHPLEKGNTPSRFTDQNTLFA